MAASSESTPVIPNPKPLFTTDPVEYIKLTSEEGENQHVFIIDKDAALRYSSTIKDLLGIAQDMKDLNDPSTSAGPEMNIEFREIPTRALEVCVKFFYWKKRWANVVTERIPEFPLPTDKNIALNTLVAANELRC